MGTTAERLTNISTSGIKVVGLENVMRAFDAFNLQMRKSVGQQVKLTTQATLNAFSGTTKKAPPKREVITLRHKTGNFHVDWKAGTVEKEMEEHFAVKFWNSGHIKLRFLPYSVKKISEAKRSPMRNIGFRGLAKKSWWFTGRKTGVSVLDTGTREKARTKAEEAARDSKSNFKGDEPYAFVSNALPYIEKAFYSKGDHTAATIAHRAERWLEERLKRDIAKGLN